MLYLTYRPRTLEELDNSKVKSTIANFLKQKDVPHSWLFVGHKGMGKTSVARILAKELCKTGDPKKDASIAQSIESGASSDIREINGADNTGIEDVRKLIDTIAFAPMNLPIRMYIIDEVHMLSTSAFNGLLKILEEPPKHAIFVLATTAIDKIPSTVRSRCVTVDFGFAKEEDVLHMLARIEKGENMQIPDETKHLIAQNCDRSFRDATKLLEELIAQNALLPEKASVYIGVRSKEILLEALAKKDATTAIAWLQSFTQEGGDAKLLIEDTIRKLHSLMLKAHNLKPEYPVGEHAFTPKDLAKLLKLMHEAYASSRISPVASSAIQIAIIDFCQS